MQLGQRGFDFKGYQSCRLKEVLHENTSIIDQIWSHFSGLKFSCDEYVEVYKLSLRRNCTEENTIREILLKAMMHDNDKFGLLCGIRINY